jgi:hypothetical protein
MEGANVLRTYNLISLLAQQRLVDYVPNSGGCKGYLSFKAIFYVHNLGDYPHFLSAQGKAGYMSEGNDPLISIDDLLRVTPHRKLELSKAVSEQPTVVLLQASKDF